MRIVRIDTAVVEANYDYTYVRIEDDDGLRGLGECFFAPGLTAIIGDLAPLLIGEDPRRYDYLWSRLRWAASGAGSVAGVVWNAISGIEAALLDLAGRQLGVPVYQLLGGRYRDEVRVYKDCHAGDSLESLDAVLVPRPMPGAGAAAQLLEAEARPAHGRAGGLDTDSTGFTPEDYAASAVEAVREGFDAIKFDLDVPNPHSLDPISGCLRNGEIKHMVALAAAVREAVGDAVDIAFDCHWRYNVSDAQRLAWELEPLGLMWLEDPIPPDNPAALREVRRASRTPICTGENLYLRHGFRELLETGAAHIISPDLQKVGGVMEARRIADLADLHYVAVAPHCIASPVGTMVAAQLAMAIPTFQVLEWHGASVPFWDDLVCRDQGGTLIERGRIAVDDSPGLGLVLNEELAREYCRPGEPFFGERL
jgi:gluconate/galactonate dehydratase